MQHLGDITKLDGAKTACISSRLVRHVRIYQRFGAREGLAGAKSGLFHHAIRIIQEMRCATDGKYPVIAVWGKR